MFKKSIIILFVFVIILFTNSLVKLEYGMNIIEYLTSNTPLSEEEVIYLHNHGTFIYGADQNSPPLRYVNERTKQYEGLSIDYINALSLELGINIEIKPLMWSDALNKLKLGAIDLCDMYSSEERAKDFLFSDPIYYQRGAILIKKSNTSIKSVEDLENKTISGNQGDLVFEFIQREFNNIIGIESSDLYEAIQLLTSGDVDAVLGDESVMNYILNKEQLKNEYTILNKYLYEREAVLAVSKDNKLLLQIFNKAIKNLNKKQTMEMINRKWFGTSPLIVKSNSNDKVKLIASYVLIIGIIIAGALYAWNIQLKREVQKHTKDLRISKNELETVFNGLTHLMIVIDEDCNIKNGNATFSNLYKLKSKEVCGKNCIDVNSILNFKCESCIIKKTFNSNSSQSINMNNNNRNYKINTYILEQVQNMKHKVLVTMEDITEFKLTEQKMLQSTKMAAIGQLAAGIAHEIRTPLGIIRNNLYYMKKSNSKEDREESMEAVEMSVIRANKIIDNLLNFSRLSDNLVSEYNINDLINEILDLNSKFLKNKKINFDLECDSNLIVYINVESFKHVIINLINNAVESMINGGYISIKISSDYEYITIEIKDTGIGMSEETLHHIFEPFYTTKADGTGLGLYITYNEIQKMNGTINAVSKINIGTTFTLIIPTKNPIIMEG